MMELFETVKIIPPHTLPWAHIYNYIWNNSSEKADRNQKPAE